MNSPRRCAALWEGNPIRRLILALDALMGLREADHSGDVGLAAAVTLAELAGVDAVRLGIDDELKPVTESDALNARRAARCFELRMTASPGLLKVALEARPDRVLLAASAHDGGWAGGPLNLRARAQPLAPVIHGLQEAGIPVSLRVLPKLDAVKAAHEERNSIPRRFSICPRRSARQNSSRSLTRFGSPPNCECGSVSVAGSTTEQFQKYSTACRLQSVSRLVGPQYLGRSWWAWIERFEI